MSHSSQHLHQQKFFESWKALFRRNALALYEIWNIEPSVPSPVVVLTEAIYTTSRGRSSDGLPTRYYPVWDTTSGQIKRKQTYFCSSWSDKMSGTTFIDWENIKRCKLLILNNKAAHKIQSSQALKNLCILPIFHSKDTLK